MMTVRRLVLAGAAIITAVGFYERAPTDQMRLAAAAYGVVSVVLAVRLLRRTPIPGEDLEPETAADVDDDDDDRELCRGSAVHGSSMRSPGGTLVLTPRTLDFTHVRGELAIPLHRITKVEKGRTLLVFDNQIVLTLRNGSRETFQLSERRDVWFEALSSIIASRPGAG